ncbi:membrane protein insertion efficiency factor YidD [Labedella populi]|uniref:Putative membrane protein insertion efficiency factor n=1 Tax=Labedella populi TaxID=2498850 RepID=A0A3S3ZYT8_9MICO|nr:membrane protein insertion efficiency factor YidD [Labedella populi]RWZ67881.1 membrane protein insertion efficiency factor YidD [Labedella populi]
MTATRSSADLRHPLLIAFDALVLVPRNVAVAILIVYRRVVSPLYGDVCRYYPSCSSYTLQAIQRFGLLIGAFFGARRLLRCHPWAEGGFDEIPEKRSFRHVVTRMGFVLPSSQRKG